MLSLWTPEHPSSGALSLVHLQLQISSPTPSTLWHSLKRPLRMQLAEDYKSRLVLWVIILICVTVIFTTVAALVPGVFHCGLKFWDVCAVARLHSKSIKHGRPSCWEAPAIITAWTRILRLVSPGLCNLKWCRRRSQCSKNSFQKSIELMKHNATINIQI